MIVYIASLFLLILLGDDTIYIDGIGYVVVCTVVM